MKPTEKQAYLQRIAVVGSRLVGKTSLINRQLTGQFNQDFSITLAPRLYTTYVQKNEKKMFLFIEDTPSGQSYHKIALSCVERAHATIIVIDPSSIDEQKFEKDVFEKWLQYLPKNHLVMIFCNKFDLVVEEEIERKKQEMNEYYKRLKQETEHKLLYLHFGSAKDKERNDKGIQIMFEHIFDLLPVEGSFDDPSSIAPSARSSMSSLSGLEGGKKRKKVLGIFGL